jgi:hypothetical protein
MPNLLKQLELEELSLVDRPANAQAMVTLFKRDNSVKEETMTEETNIEVEMVEKADFDTLKLENEKLRKALLENGFVITAEAIEKKAPEEFIEVEGESVNKADIPAVILKALEAADQAKIQHELEKADMALTKKAEEVLPHFAADVAKSLLKSFAEDEVTMEALKAADKAFEAAMQEFGKSDADGDFLSATDKLDALVKSYMDTNQLKKSDYAKAYAVVAKTQEGKALINKTYKGE